MNFMCGVLRERGVGSYGNKPVSTPVVPPPAAPGSKCGEMSGPEVCVSA